MAGAVSCDGNIVLDEAHSMGATLPREHAQELEYTVSELRQ